MPHIPNQVLLRCPQENYVIKRGVLGNGYVIEGTDTVGVDTYYSCLPIDQSTVATLFAENGLTWRNEQEIVEA